jgi:hypothetical protein
MMTHTAPPFLPSGTFNTGGGFPTNVESFTVTRAGTSLLDLAKTFQSIVDENQSQGDYPDSSVEMFSRRRLEASMDRESSLPAEQRSANYDRYTELLEDSTNMWFGTVSLGS